MEGLLVVGVGSAEAVSEVVKVPLMTAAALPA